MPSPEKTPPEDYHQSIEKESHQRRLYQNLRPKNIRQWQHTHIDLYFHLSRTFFAVGQNAIYINI